jgi:excisionase family DNA binding protein
MKPRHAAAPGPIMTSKEVAEYLRISQTTLYRLIRRGEIPSFKVGVDYRFRRDAIDK